MAKRGGIARRNSGGRGGSRGGRGGRNSSGPAKRGKQNGGRFNPTGGKKRGGRGGRGKSRGGRGGSVSADALDADMEAYWGKSENPEIKAKVAAEREARLQARLDAKKKSMDDDMDKYWAEKEKKATEETKTAEKPAAEGKAEEAAPAAKTE